MGNYVGEVSRVEADREAFADLGIFEDTLFELRELTGKYMIDIPNRCVYEVNIYRTPNAATWRRRVSGLYEHILDGTWHKSVNRSGQYD